MAKPCDLSGKIFGMWTVVSHIPTSKENKSSKWLCTCNGCGRECLRSVGDIKKYNKYGCISCYLKTKNDRISKKSEYNTWFSMISRCYKESNHSYDDYGARGIKVCKRWHKFKNFYKDMGSRPLNKSLDRINNDGNYELSNCRWATRKQQQNNTRMNKYLTFRDKTMTVSEWSVVLAISVSTLHYRLRNGWSIEKVLTTPRR